MSECFFLTLQVAPLKFRKYGHVSYNLAKIKVAQGKPEIETAGHKPIKLPLLGFDYCLVVQHLFDMM